jgi:hypothetical protein
MSQKAVESVLGRMITDVEFRTRFFARPVEACEESDCALTAREKEALLRIDLGALNRLAVGLDPKIVRAASLAVTRGERANDMAAKAPSPDRPAIGSSRN